MQAKRIFLALFVVAVNLVPRTQVEACAVCLTGAAGDRLVDAFNWSVLFLMGAPYAVFGVVAGWLFYIHRRATRGSDGDRRRSPVLRLAWVNKGSGR